MFRLVVLACFIYSASAVSVEESEQLRSDDQEWYSGVIEFPDAEGNVYSVDLEAPVDYETLNQIENEQTFNEYWLFTRQNPETPQILKRNDADSILNSNFDPTKETVFIIHGWRNKASTEPNLSLRPVFLEVSDVNVISVDWSTFSTRDYISATLEAPTVGRHLGQFINYLAEEFQLSYDNIHLVGYSLGAHISGNAGRETGGKIARITGCEPAGPLWNSNPYKLTSTDAVYVEAIFTDGFLSLIVDCAQVEFYINNGISQPGCSNDRSCNHRRSWEIFAASLKYSQIIGKRCSNLLLRQLNMCGGEQLALGNNILRKNALHGHYRVNTGAEYPYFETAV